MNVVHFHTKDLVSVLEHINRNLPPEIELDKRNQFILNGDVVGNIGARGADYFTVAMPDGYDFAPTGGRLHTLITGTIHGDLDLGLRERSGLDMPTKDSYVFDHGAIVFVKTGHDTYIYEAIAELPHLLGILTRLNQKGCIR